MEAKDTILTINTERNIYTEWRGLNKNTRPSWRDYWLLNQAAVSFKAGERKVMEAVEKLHLVRPERENKWQEFLESEKKI